MRISQLYILLVLIFGGCSGGVADSASPTECPEHNYHDQNSYLLPVSEADTPVHNSLCVRAPCVSGACDYLRETSPDSCGDWLVCPQNDDDVGRCHQRVWQAGCGDTACEDQGRREAVDRQIMKVCGP